MYCGLVGFFVYLDISRKKTGLASIDKDVYFFLGTESF